MHHARDPMTSVTRATLSVCLPLVGVLARLVAAESPIPALKLTPGVTEVRVEAPNLRYDPSGALIAPRGFVANLGDKILIGDALRYDKEGDDLYATGTIVLAMPGVRIHASRIGLHPNAETGEAWDVEAFVDHAGRRLTITAEKVIISRQELRFDGVHAIAGHGGLAGFGASSARVYLRDKPATDRQGFERQVEGIELVGSTVRLADIPVFWIPYLYRDFYYDYPWTRYEGGKTRRLGYYARGWVGTNLRSIFDWRPHIEARGDMYSRTGEAWGLRGTWTNPDLGKGQITWFDIPHEQVMGGPDDLTTVATRHASLFDVEQQLHGLGGAVYGRWAKLPDADPPYPGDPAQPWDERFRADYLRDDLEERAFIRRGVTGTWGTSLGTITIDTERRAHPDQVLTDRIWGVQVQLPRLQIAGPLHIGGSGWSERLENTTTDDQAVRTSFNGSASAMQWLGPLGIDAGGGVQGLAYQDAQLAGVELDRDQARVVPVITAGVRTRFVGDWGNGLTHVFTPRVGLQLYQEGTGDELSTWNFGDPRDRLEEDLQLGTAGFDTSITGERSLFRASAVARWALRPQDREYTDLVGNPQTADTALVDVSGTVEGAPIATLRVTGTVIYDAQIEDWRAFDVTTSWVATSWSELRYSGTLVPATATEERSWQHRPGVTGIANRYRFDGDVTFRPGGDVIDRWTAELTRRMVDGDLTLTYELIRDDEGHIYDRRFGVRFSMSLGGTGPSKSGTEPPPGFMAR